MIKLGTISFIDGKQAMISELQKKISGVRAARIAMNRSDWKRATRQYEALAWEYSEDPSILEALCQCYEKAGAPQKAVPLLKMAQDLYLMKGRNAKAQDIRDKADELNLFLPYFEN
jgi:lipopolysaccharide biosynthesis regulator YciM